MSNPKHTSTSTLAENMEKDRILIRLEKHLLRGVTNKSELAAAFGVTIPVIAAWMREVYERWKEEAITDVDQSRVIRVRQLDAIACLALNAFDRANVAALRSRPAQTSRADVTTDLNGCAIERKHRGMALRRGIGRHGSGIDGPGEGQKIPWNRFCGTTRRTIFACAIGRCNTLHGGWVEQYTLDGKLEYEHRSRKEIAPSDL